MKAKKSTVVEITILSLLALLVVLSLLIPQFLRDRGQERLWSLSVLLRDTDSSSWNVARQGMEQAADELGAELRFLTLTVQNDPKEQEELLRREVEGGADALIAVPADPDGLYGALRRASDACPLVLLEADPAEGAVSVAPDNALLGQRLAEALLEDWEGAGTVLLLDTSAACPEVRPRLEAASQALGAAGVPVDRIYSVPEDPGVRWVMAFESGATRLAGQKKEESGHDFALYGVGSSPVTTAQLERGTIAAVAAWSDYAAGYLAVQQAVQALHGHSQLLDPLPFSIVRGEDIYAPENQKLLFPITS